MSSVNPGINPHFNFEHFTQDEIQIIERWSTHQYVTNAGREVHVGNSVYRYFLFKPTEVLSTMFNFSRELVVLFAPYENFEPRTLEVYSQILKFHQNLRIDPICGILISKDVDIGDKLAQLLQGSPESLSVVPFRYADFQTPDSDPFFVRNQFKKFLFTRDLFAFSGVLNTELFFYGREELMMDIITRHKSHENFGLFGLRRTGKTSTIFGVKRKLELDGGFSSFIDCQNTSFNQRRWFTAMYYVAVEVVKQSGLRYVVPDSDYTPENASLAFERDLRVVSSGIQKNILLMFDEIENITFGVSSVPHWGTGLDFIYFWQAIRSVYQKTTYFTFVVVGTNPTCVEKPLVNTVDNPIYNQIQYRYIPGFTVNNTRDMVRKLGRIMGLKFDETIYSKLTEDFGGHPFLIRQMCSILNKMLAFERPVTADRETYRKAKDDFQSSGEDYIVMILSVLLQFYNDEYEMLRILAIEDLDYFNELAENSPSFVKHLIGYGIIEHVNGNFLFKIDAVKAYLRKKEKYTKIKMTNEEKLAEVSERRNRLEPQLRTIVRQLLLASYGVKGARQRVLDAMKPHDRGGAEVHNYQDLFDPRKVNIYFDTLRSIMDSNWGAFQHVFQRDKHEVLGNLSLVNRMRVDAHASTLSDDEMQQFRVAIGVIEMAIEGFF